MPKKRVSRERHVNESRDSKHLCCILKGNGHLEVQNITINKTQCIECITCDDMHPNVLMISLVKSMKHLRKKPALLNVKLFE